MEGRPLEEHSGLFALTLLTSTKEGKETIPLRTGLLFAQPHGESIYTVVYLVDSSELLVNLALL